MKRGRFLLNQPLFVGCGRGTWTPDLRVMRSTPQVFHSPAAAHDIPRSQYFQGLRGICIPICSHRIPSNPTAVGVSVGVSPKKGRIVKPIGLTQPRAKCTFRFLPLWDSIHQGPDRIRHRSLGSQNRTNILIIQSRSITIGTPFRNR